jgi:hypothetical protein
MTLACRGVKLQWSSARAPKDEKAGTHNPGLDERVMGLEPTISCLGSKRSTTELHPLTCDIMIPAEAEAVKRGGAATKYDQKYSIISYG